MLRNKVYMIYSESDLHKLDTDVSKPAKTSGHIQTISDTTMMLSVS